MARPAALALCLLTIAACGSDGDPPRTAAATAAPAPTADHGDRDAAADAAQASRGVRLVAVGRFSSPLYVTAPPGDRRRIHVVEQGGRIVVVRGGRRLSRPFLDIRSRVQAGGEQGLLGLAFAADFARSKRFYVYYTRRDGRQTLVEFRARSADVADASSARTVFVHADPEGNHNGGNLQFGPDDLLYVGTGDGGGAGDQHGSRGNGQSLSSPLGKLLRIDPRRRGGRAFRVPTSNPFVGRSGARPEIYSYGLRNPWRFSFDRRNGDLVIADVGQNAIEEVTFVRRGRGRGANFGWRPFEGTRRFAAGSAPGHVRPQIEHSHDDGWCSITGGYVVRDAAVPGLEGRYVYGDLCLGRIMSARLTSDAARDVRAVPGVRRVASLSSFGEDARGRVYAVSLEGPVYRFVAAG